MSTRDIKIEALKSSPEIRDMLSDILIEAVASGGLVSFMHPLDRETANVFWDDALSAMEHGERVILGAWDGETLAGTATLRLNCAQNQPQRGEVLKLMTRIGHRGRGVAKALMRAIEDLAVERGRRLLTLHTAAEGGAKDLYEGLGYSLAGTIPDYSLKPLGGGLTGQMIYWKRIGR